MLAEARHLRRELPSGQFVGLLLEARPTGEREIDLALPGARLHLQMDLFAGLVLVEQLL